MIWGERMNEYDEIRSVIERAIFTAVILVRAWFVPRLNWLPGQREFQRCHGHFRRVFIIYTNSIIHLDSE